jgi:hypothetical protein
MWQSIRIVVMYSVMPSPTDENHRRHVSEHGMM